MIMTGCDNLQDVPMDILARSKKWVKFYRKFQLKIII
jgi:hypothetical protein